MGFLATEFWLALFAALALVFGDLFAWPWAGG
jgi:hypothetical protein